MTWKEFVTLDGEAWERSKNALADALGCTRAELEKQLTEFFSDKPTAKP
jgi:biotin operon repressor